MSHSHFSRALLSAALLAALPASTLAQSPARDPRITLTAVAGGENVSIDAGGGTFTIGGAAVRLRILRFLSFEAEVTTGTGEATDSYEGVFTSIAPPGSTIAEIERLGVVLRRDRVWTPGTGYAFGLAFHTPSSYRAGLSAAIGLAGREITEVDTKTLIRLPEEWPATLSVGDGTSTSSRARGGPFVTVAVPVNVTSRLLVVPEIRILRTLADEDFTSTSYRIQAGWRF